MEAHTFENEQAMFVYIEAYFSAKGYDVKGEVKHCDVVAVKESDEPLLIEMKLAFSIGLLSQAAKRKLISQNVYVAVPEPGMRKRASDYKAICRAMNIGLLFISNAGTVFEAVTPENLKPAKKSRSKKRKALLKEFYTRKSKANQGGSTRTKLLTAYREQALTCAYSLLTLSDGLPAAQVRKHSGVRRAGEILRDNVYGWFERHDPINATTGKKGMPQYSLSETGRNEYAEWNTKWTNPLLQNDLKQSQS